MFDMFDMNSPRGKALAEKISREMRENKDEAFRQFLEMPATKFMMSVVPPPENPDALPSLLKATFDTAYAAGSVKTIMSMAEHVMKGLRDDLK